MSERTDTTGDESYRAQLTALLVGLLVAALDAIETRYPGCVRLARTYADDPWLLLQDLNIAPDEPAGARNRAQQDTIINAVGIVIIGAVGATIVGAVISSFDSPENTGLSEGQDSLVSGFGQMLNLVKPLLIVLMAVLIIFAVQRLQG